MDIGSITRLAQNHIDLLIKLTPNSSTDKIVGIIDAGDEEMRLAVKVHAVPEKGKANKAVVDFMAKKLSLPKSTLEIASGGTNRNKTIRITGEPKIILERLQQLEF